MNFSRKQLTTIAIHVFIWAAIALIPLLFKPTEVIFNTMQLQGIYLHLVVTILVFYLSYSIIIPSFFYKKRITITLVLLVLVSVAGSLMVRFGRRTIVEQHLLRHPRELREDLKMPRRKLKQMRFRHPTYDNIFLFLLISGAALSIRVTQKWMQEEQDRKSLEADKTAIELAWLKNQVSPHFFFNTLNNIHSLIESNPGFAQKSIHMLSKLMRHLLYDSNASLISLKKEISFIENYIGLMKLKLTDIVKISFKYPTIPENISLPPLLFNPLIENAFKFGVSYTDESFIKIELGLENKQIILGVENSISKSDAQQEHSGIGLVNLKQRLDLLFKDKYTLHIRESSTNYKVELKIPAHES